MNEFTLIEAAGGARPKIVGTAYSGGKMSLPGWKNPVVVDLSGMELPESVPLLANHENRTSSRIGMVSASVKNNVLEISGEIISDSSEAADIVAQSKAGADWQLSIGADVRECELVRGKREVNGQEIDGPFYHVRKSALREVSVVAVGADAHTSMKVTAKFNLTNPEEEGENMNETKDVEAKADVQPEVKPEAKPEVKPEIKAEAKPEIQAAQPEVKPEAAPVDVAAAARDAAAAAVKAERDRGISRNRERRDFRRLDAGSRDEEGARNHSRRTSCRQCPHLRENRAGR